MIEPIETSEFAAPANFNETFYGVRLSTGITLATLAARGVGWYEAFDLSIDVFVLLIGDVCGHGAEKAAAMVALRQSIRDANWLGLTRAQSIRGGAQCARRDHFSSLSVRDQGLEAWERLTNRKWIF